jgi:mannose-6-phosphate isomerase
MSGGTMKTVTPWGFHEIIKQSDDHLAKFLYLKDGQRTSLQYHERKTERVIVARGKLTVQLEKRCDKAGCESLHSHLIELNRFESLLIPNGTIHRMIADNGDVYYYEVSDNEPDDCIRISDDYGRV